MDIKKIAWLGGAWDGEGSITVFKHREKNGVVKLCPTLVLTNTESSFIQEAVEILDENGLSFHLMSYKRGENKECYQLITRNLEKIKKFLELMTPYLVSKKPQAKLLMRFVDSRLVHKREGRKWGHNTPYSEEEQSIEEQMRILNGRRPRDYTSNTKKVKI